MAGDQAIGAMGLLTHALRLSLAAVVSVLAFLALEVPLGYVTIQFQFGVQPLVARSEFSSLLLGLTVAVPLMFGLSILGMTLAWSTCRTYGIPALVVHGCVCGRSSRLPRPLSRFPQLWRVVVLLAARAGRCRQLLADTAPCPTAEDRS